MTPRVRKRMLAMMLGLGLATLVTLGPVGCVGWLEADGSGWEVWTRCHWTREVQQFGPLRYVSRPEPRVWLRVPQPAEYACANHEWERRGCWYGASRISCYF